MKRKVRIDRVIVLLLGLVLVISLIFFGGKTLLSFVFNDDNPSNTTTPNNTSETEVIKEFSIDLVDYKTYKLDDVDFNFVLARIRFKDVKPINYSLASLYTDEKTVKIAEYDKYIKELEAKEYYLGARNVNYKIKSDKNSGIFTLFIPVIDKNKTSLVLYDAVAKNEIKFDLNQNVGDPSELHYHTGDDEVIETEDYQIQVNNAYIENSFYKDGNEYNYPSTIKIYTFVLDIKKLTNDGLVLEDAIFVPDDSSDEIHALDASITSMKINNLISHKIKEGDHGALFFEIFNPEDSGITYNGTLKLKFSNSDNWLSLKTELK